MSTGSTYANVGWVEDEGQFDGIYIRHDVLTTAGQLITHNNTNGLSQAVPAGTPGQVLVANATPVGMAWGGASALGSITVNGSGPLVITNSPVTLGGLPLGINNTALNSVGTRSWIAGTGAAYGVDGVSVGNLAVSGDFCISIGSNSFSDASSVGIGAGCLAAGTESCALGRNSQATFLQSSAFGFDSRALGQTTISIGSGTRANNTGAIVLGANSVVSSDNCTAIGTGITNAVPKTTLIGSQATPTEHTVRSTGYIQSARACAAKAIRDFAGGDPTQNISFPTFPQALNWVSAAYDTFTTANNAAITSWSGAAPEYLNIGAVPNATYLASLNVEMNYLIVGGTLNVTTFQIVYDNNGTNERVGIATAQQVDVNYLNYRVSVSGQFRVGAAPTGNQRIYALANSINGGVGIAITNAQLSIVRLV